MKCMIQQRHLPKQLDAPRGPTTAAATLERQIDTAMWDSYEGDKSPGCGARSQRSSFLLNSALGQARAG
jgi:hypothetical protein